MVCGCVYISHNPYWVLCIFRKHIVIPFCFQFSVIFWYLCFHELCHFIIQYESVSHSYYWYLDLLYFYVTLTHPPPHKYHKLQNRLHALKSNIAENIEVTNGKLSQNITTRVLYRCVSSQYTLLESWCDVVFTCHGLNRWSRKCICNAINSVSFHSMHII